jgi:hypothetical protein
MAPAPDRDSCPDALAVPGALGMPLYLGHKLAERPATWL